MDDAHRAHATAGRLVWIAAWPAVIAAAIFYDLLRPAPGVDTTGWLAALLGAYAVNYLIAWRFVGSWGWTLGRSLAWAVVAYLLVDAVIDQIGTSHFTLGQLIGLDGPAVTPGLDAARRLLAARVIGLVAAAGCIAVGFEGAEQGETAD